MKLARDCFWSLCNADASVRIDGLKTVQLSSLIEGFSEKTISSWFAWQEGTDEWVPLSSVVVELKKSSSSTIPVPPPFGTQSGVSDFDDDRFKISKRLTPRYAKQMKAIIESNGSLQTTETLDISVTGIKVRDPVQASAGSHVNVTLFRDNTELAMKCRVLSPEDGSRPHLLLIEICNRHDILNAWILS